MEPDLLWLVALPAALAVVAMLATRPWRRGRDLPGSGAAIAIAGGFVIAFYNLYGSFPPFPPVAAQQWLVFLAGAVVVVAIIQAFAKNKWLGIALSSPVLLLTPWLLLRKLTFDDSTQRVAWIVGGGLIMVAWWLSMELLARRTRGGSLPLTIALAVGVAGLTMIDAHAALFGQISGAMAVPLVVVAAAGTWSRGASLARGGILAVAVLMLGLLIASAHLADLQLRDLALLAASPLAAWAGELPKLGSPDSWKRLVVRIVAVSLVLALPAVTSVKGLRETVREQDPYSYY